MVQKLNINPLNKIVRITKLAALSLIIGANVCFANNLYSQSTLLSLKLNNTTVKEVFNEIEKSSEYVFFYYDGVLDVNRKVRVDVKNQTIDKILNQLFEGTSNTYVIKDRQIFVSKKQDAVIPNPSPIVSQQRSMVKGKVLDDLGEPLPGAAVMVVGSTRGVTTDLDGSFEIEVTSSEKLTISFLGMQDQTVAVGNQKNCGETSS